MGLGRSARRHPAGAALIGVGGYAFVHVNVEAYPDPAPAIIEVIAQYPGAIGRGNRAPGHHSAGSGVGRHARAEIPRAANRCSGCRICATSSTTASIQKTPGSEVINRLQFAEDLPPRTCSRRSRRLRPIGEIVPLHAAQSDGRPGPADLHAQRSEIAAGLDAASGNSAGVPRIADVVSIGGTVKRYEIQPDPDRLRRYGITLDQLQAAIADSNMQRGGRLSC